MIYIATLRHCLEYIGTFFPTSLFEATFHAVELRAAAARRGGVRYIDTLQELTACQPELLDCPVEMVIDDTGQEQEGMIFLQGDTSALFLFRIMLEVPAHQGARHTGRLALHESSREKATFDDGEKATEE